MVAYYIKTVNGKMRGQNKDFIINSIKTLFRVNWNINIDVDEVDTSISIAENVTILIEKYKTIINRNIYILV